MTILCTIAMRGGSRGVPKKNSRVIMGKPLMAYTIEQALGSELFDHIVVSTDSKDFSDIAKSYGAESWFLRPPELATHEAGKVAVIRHALLESENNYGIQFDTIIDLDVTSPLRDIDDIKAAYQQFLNERSDVLITGCNARRNPYFNMVETSEGNVRLVKNHEPPLVRRQDAPQVYDMNASIYIWKRDILLREKTLFRNSTSLYVMPEERSIDIDTEMDFEIVEFLLKKQAGMGNA